METLTFAKPKIAEMFKNAGLVDHREIVTWAMVIRKKTKGQLAKEVLKETLWALAGFMSVEQNGAWVSLNGESLNITYEFHKNAEKMLAKTIQITAADIETMYTYQASIFIVKIKPEVEGGPSHEFQIVFKKKNMHLINYIVDVLDREKFQGDLDKKTIKALQ